MKRNLKRKILAVMMALTLIVTLGLSAPGTQVYAATITTPLDFTLESTNDDYPGSTGDGWIWDVDTKTLTLDGLDLQCSDEEGPAINLPDDSTIVITDGSENSISHTGDRGIVCCGDLNITGSGKLTIKSRHIGIRAVGDLTIDGLTSLVIQSERNQGIRIGMGDDQDNGSKGSLSITNCTTVDIESNYQPIRAIGNVLVEGVGSLTLYTENDGGIRAGPDYDAEHYSGVPGHISILNSGAVLITSQKTALRTWGDVLFDTVDSVSINSTDGTGIRTGTDGSGYPELDNIAQADVTIVNCGSFAIEAESSGIRSIGDVHLEAVDDFTITSAKNGIRCGPDDEEEKTSGAAGNLDIIDCGTVNITDTEKNAVAVYGDMCAVNVASLTMTGLNKGLKTWGSASFIDCGFVQAIATIEYDGDIQSDPGYGITSGEGVVIQRTTLEAYGALYGIVTGDYCDESIRPTGGDIVIDHSNVDASCGEEGSAAIYAGDDINAGEDSDFHASIILTDAVIISPVGGYIVDVEFDYTCQTVTDTPNLAKVTKWDDASNSVTIRALHRVLYDANGGTGSLTDDSNPYVMGGEVTLLDNMFTKEFHSFAGWNTRADGTGIAYGVGDTFEISSDITLHAQWTINDYTIAFDSNGGSEVADITQNAGTSITAPTDPTREGYIFNGWLPDIPKTMPAKDMTLKAQWTPISQEDVPATGETDPYFAAGVSLLLAAAGISILLRREKAKNEATK